MNDNEAVFTALKGRGGQRTRDNDGLHKRRGIWHYKLKVGGRWREVSAATKNYQEARNTRREALQAQEEGRLPTDMAKWPFERAAKEWWEGRVNALAPQTHRKERHRLKPLREAFGGQRLCDITSHDLRRYQVRRSAQVSAATVNAEGNILRMILKSVKVWSRVADDYKRLRENTRGPGRALSPEDEKRLFSTAGTKPAWQAAYYAALLAANTTARGCEIKGLRLADVDLMTATMTIRRTSTKTDAGCRIVPLNQTAAWAVARLLERATKLGATHEEHYLFPAFPFRQKNRPAGAAAAFDASRPMKTWRTAWRAVTKEAGLRGLRFHDLRHHCVTKLAEAGVPDQTLMAIAGHVSRQMLEHYSHIRMQSKRAAVDALESPKANSQGQETIAAVN